MSKRKVEVGNAFVPKGGERVKLKSNKTATASTMLSRNFDALNEEEHVTPPHTKKSRELAEAPGQVASKPTPQLPSSDWSLKCNAVFSTKDFDLVSWPRRTRPVFHLKPTSARPRDEFISSFIHCEAILIGGGGEAALLEWRNSFCSLYFAFRHGLVDLFYTTTRDYTIVWRAGEAANGENGETWRRPCWAVVSKSDRRFRQQLRENGVEFSMPADPQGEVVRMDQAAEEASEAVPPSRQNVEGRTVLHVAGHTDVHGLFDTLLEQAGNVGASRLLCSQPFMGSKLSTAVVKFSGQVRAKNGTCHDQVDIEGTILPDSLHRACQALACISQATAGRTSFSAMFTPKPDTIEMAKFSSLDGSAEENFAISRVTYDSSFRCGGSPERGGFQVGVHDR